MQKLEVKQELKENNSHQISDVVMMVATVFSTLLVAAIVILFIIKLRTGSAAEVLLKKGTEEKNYAATV